MKKTPSLPIGLLCAALLAGCAATRGTPDSATAETMTGLDPAATSLAARALATIEVALAHCPQIRVNPRERDRIVRASGREEGELRESEDFVRQLLQLNPLIDNYDHATGCRLLSRSHDTDAPGLLSMD